MIDLHAHSTASDGDLSPEELVDLGMETGLGALALTDHDTVDGLDRAAARAAEAGLPFVPGVEIEVDFRPGEFHLLGLGLKNWGTTVGPFLTELQARRRTRNASMVELMRADGLDITLEGMEAALEGEILGRLHFARWLIDRKKARNIPEAFELWLGPGKPYHVPKNRPSLDEAVAAIHGAEGLAVIAHPLSLWISWGKLATRLAEWKELGLDGIESRHSGASAREAERFEGLAGKIGLICTGGSDFHGEGRPDRKLGLGAGKKPVPDAYLEPFLPGSGG